MAIKDELREQFDFFKRQPFENKKEYKKRVTARGQELLDRKNCTLKDAITFRALVNCRANGSTITIDGKTWFVGDLTAEDYAHSQGNAKDYEKFVDALFFKYLDEYKFCSERRTLYSEFSREKANTYDDFIKTQFSHPYDLESEIPRRYYPPSSYLYGCCDPEEAELLEDEKVEEFYSGKVKGKDGKVKVKGVTLEGRVFWK